LAEGHRGDASGPAGPEYKSRYRDQEQESCALDLFW